MQRDMMKWVDDLIAAPRKKAMPILSFPAITRMGITVKDLVASSDLQAQAMKLVADETPDSAASVSMMDLSVEAEAFGSKIRISDHEVPAVVGSLVEEEEEVEALQIPEIGAGRTGVYIDAIRKASQLITDRPVLAGVIGPFSLAGRLTDISNAMLLCLDEPDMMHALLEKVSTFLISYINAYKDAGANGVVMAEPLAGLLSPALAEEFSSDYVSRIVGAVQTDTFLVVYHNCGNTVTRQTDVLSELGCRILHFGNSIDMAQILPEIPGDIVAMGNIDPAGQFRGGTPETMRAAVMDLMDRCGDHPNFVISSGCDIPPLSDWDNINAFFEAVGDFYSGNR